MSWLFSRALVEEYWRENCLDGEQFAPLSGNPTQLAYLPPDKMTDFSRLSRFGMTYKPLTESRGEELLMSYLAAFPARTYPSQEKAQDSTESEAECGSTWRGWLAKYDPATSSWKTAQCSFIEDLNESCPTLPRSGMTRDGLLWELPMLERRTSETGSGSSQSWPTPRSCSAMAATITRESSWNKNRFPNLETVVGRRQWPTPTAHNAKEGAFPSEHNRNTPTLSAQAGGSLNPTWVEWLMGWPLKWTDLKPLETDKSHCAPQPHFSI